MLRIARVDADATIHPDGIAVPGAWTADRPNVDTTTWRDLRVTYGGGLVEVFVDGDRLTTASGRATTRRRASGGLRRTGVPDGRVLVLDYTTGRPSRKSVLWGYVLAIDGRGPRSPITTK